MFMKVELRSDMNEQDMLAALPPLLAEFGAQVEIEAGPPRQRGVDAWVRVTVPGAAPRTYAVEVKRRLTPSLATALPHVEGAPLLVVTPHVTDGVGEILRAMSVDYVDMIGNSSLRWTGVHIDVRGRRAAKDTLSPGPGTGDRAFTRAGLQVLFVLLSQPSSASATLRQLAEASGTSLGTAQAVVEQLERTGALVTTTAGRHLHRPGTLYDRWVQGYATRLSSSLAIRSFRADRIDWWPAAQAADRDLVLSGETAAAALDPMLRPASLTFYVTGTPARLIREHRLVPVAPHEANVHLRRRFWDHEVVAGGGHLAPAMLVYADLVTSGDPRQREHAERLRRTDARLVELDGS